MTAIINNARLRSMVSLGKFDYVPGGKEVVKIFQDLVVAKFLIVAKGDLIATFDGSGTLTKPVVRPYGILDGLIESMTLARKGTDKVREYNGVRHLIETMNRMYGQKDGAFYKQNANDLGGTYSEGLPVFPATTQKLQFRDSVSMVMENINSTAAFPTLFSTKNLNTATLTIKMGQLADIKDPEDTSTAPITTNGIEFEVFAICADYLINSPDIGKFDWAQTPEELEFAGAQNKSKHFISPEGLLQGMLITGLNSDNTPFDLKEMDGTKLEINYLGTTLIEGSLADLGDRENVETHRNGRVKGSVYVSFQDAKDFQSGIPIVEGKKLQVLVTTASGLSFPAKLVFEYDQLIFDPSAIPSV